MPWSANSTDLDGFITCNNSMIYILPHLEGKFDELQVQRMVKVANLCITRAARLRPNMNQVSNAIKFLIS